MAKREKFKDIEINGRQFRIGKFDAQTGSFIAYQMLFHVLPSVFKLLPGLGGQLSGLGMGSAAEGQASAPTLSKEDFLSLQRDCLSVCSELRQVGNMAEPMPMAVMLPGGAWGVDDLEDDVMTVLHLTGQALMFNLEGFFGESGLSGMMQAAQGQDSQAGSR